MATALAGRSSGAGRGQFGGGKQASGLAGSFGKATELKQRLWFTLMALIVYRLGTYIPTPGIDSTAIDDLFKQQGGGILGVFDTFAGGALGRMSIFALNIMPYISASIIIQLMTSAFKRLEQLKKEGEAGRRIINQYTRYLTVLFATVQAYGLAVGLESLTSSAGAAVANPGTFFRLTTVITLVGGTMFLMWLGEQITSRGVGNGISLLIFAGIVANLPVALAQTFEQARVGTLATSMLLVLLVMALAVIAFIVFVERAQRRVVIHHPRRQVGNKLYGGDNTHLPLKLNTSGVIPPIFASSLLLLPVTILNFSGGTSDIEWVNTLTVLLGRGQPLYMAVYAALIIFFAFFYTALVFNPNETADNLRKSGAFIPGIRPGKSTAMYIDAVMTRLTFVGAIYLTLVCLLPELLISEYAIPFYFGGTSLLIVVTVTLDTVTQIQSHLFAHQYEGLMKKTNLKGRR